MATVIINAWEVAPYFFQTPLPSGKGHAKAFLNRNKNMKNNFCMSRTNARYRSDRIAPAARSGKAEKQDLSRVVPS